MQHAPVVPEANESADPDPGLQGVSEAGTGQGGGFPDYGHKGGPQTLRAGKSDSTQTFEPNDTVHIPMRSNTSLAVYPERQERLHGAMFLDRA